MQIETPGSPSNADLDRLAARHLPLVTHLVQETMARVPSHVDRHELVAAGLTALLGSAREQDPTRSFVELASLRIRAALVDQLRSVDWAARVARPRSRDAVRARLDSLLEQLPETAAAVLGLDLDGDPRDTAVHGGASAVLPRSTGPGSHHERADRVRCVALALDALPERHRHVVRGYFLDQRPMADLAAEVGASEARAEQLRTDALVLLREALATAFAPGADAAVADPDPATRRGLAYARAVAVQYAARRVLVARPAQRTSA